MAKRFSKEELLTGPPKNKNKFTIVVGLKTMGDESILVNEEVHGDGFEINGGGLLFLYDIDDLGEPQYVAVFKDWLYITRN